MITHNEKLDEEIKKFGSQYYGIAKQVVVEGHSSTQRQQMLVILEEVEFFMIGYFSAVSTIFGEETENHYRAYFDQARSEHGLP